MTIPNVGAIVVDPARGIGAQVTGAMGVTGYIIMH